jgi:hypothetical protein
VRVHFKDSDLSWLWLDARCHLSLLKIISVDTDALSALVLYDPNKAKFLKMGEEFTVKKMVSFLD